MSGFDELNRRTNARIQELAEKVCTGKRVAKEENELVELLEPKLRFYIWKFFKDQHHANEHTSQALQETLTRAFGSITSYDPKKGRFTTWIFNIARNTTLLYQHEVRKVPTCDIDPIFYKIDTPDDYQEVLEKENELQRVYTMTVNEILNLPETDKHGNKNLEKIILVESYINKLKGDEISKKYDINPNTVKTKKRKAISVVKKRILEKDPAVANRMRDLLDINVDRNKKKLATT